jgi:hypothetical protein
MGADARCARHGGILPFLVRAYFLRVSLKMVITEYNLLLVRAVFYEYHWKRLSSERSRLRHVYGRAGAETQSFRVEACLVIEVYVILCSAQALRVEVPPNDGA